MIITPHSFLSLNWDEWGSIILILTAVGGMIRYLMKQAKSQLFDEIYAELKKLNINMEKTNQWQRESNARFDRGTQKFIHHDEQLKDHERRITSLEEYRNEHN